MSPSILFRECRAAVGEDLIEGSDGFEALYLRERGQRWNGEVRMHRERATDAEYVTIHLEGVDPDLAADLLRTLRESTERAAVENDRPTLDHEREPDRNLNRTARLVEGLEGVLDG